MNYDTTEIMKTTLNSPQNTEFTPLIPPKPPITSRTESSQVISPLTTAPPFPTPQLHSSHPLPHLFKQTHRPNAPPQLSKRTPSPDSDAEESVLIGPVLWGSKVPFVQCKVPSGLSPLHSNENPVVLHTESQPVRWKCTTCTMENTQPDYVCAVCGIDRI